MKAIETIIYNGKILSVLVQTQSEENKGYISYFIDGLEITDFDKITKQFQRIFTALADNICEGLGLVKWSY
jgi:hypothetical protein